MSGQKPRRLDTGQGNRIVAGALFSCGVYLARRDQSVGNAQSEIGLRYFVRVGLGNAENLWQKQRSTNGNDCRFAHLGAEFEFASAPALHRSGRRSGQKWKMAKHPHRRQISVSGKGLVESFQGQVLRKTQG